MPPRKPRKTAKVTRKSPPAVVAAPTLPYQPRDPKRYRPGIALVGCGGITAWHLRAYRAAKYRVVALADVNLKNAKARRDEFYPDAFVTDDPQKIFRRDDVEIVDIATHTAVRPPLVEAALKARKHVLSQKPFVTDLAVGKRLADLADKMGVTLAVNQNARWAPHFSYMREAVRGGLIGEVEAAHCDVHWDHSWVKGTAFETTPHLILYDFAIHWFDFITTLMDGASATRVFASKVLATAQDIKAPLLAQVAIEYPTAQASLVFDGHTRFGRTDRVFIAGSAGSIASSGPDQDHQKVELTTAKGVARPKLVGSWFPDGFHGTMAELLSSIEEHRTPMNSARNNLESLALCFAAVASAETGKPVVPGTVKKLPQ
ncbi:MAG: Gfo/Idh/MocA family protein [Pirellulales bacterium]